MIWIMLATVVVVFVVGFRVLTSGTRRAIRRLSERLNIDVVPVESMIDQMGKMPGKEFLYYLHRPDESHLQNGIGCCKKRVLLRRSRMPRSVRRWVYSVS